MNGNRKPSPLHGQVVIGPPGSGKTTYCRAMKLFLTEIGRQTLLVNLDPGNEFLPDEYDLDVRQLVDLNTVIKDRDLGPNGAMVFCLELIERRVEEFVSIIEKKLNDKPICKYLLFDLPGQAELYTHHECVHNILQRVQALLKCHLVCVHVVDSQHCIDPGRFLSVLLTTLHSMLRLALPHINVLSKFDLMEHNELFLSFGIDFYTEVLDLHYLLEHMPESSFTSKYNKLSEMLSEVVQDYGLVSFQPLWALHTVLLRMGEWSETSLVFMLTFCALDSISFERTMIKKIIICILPASEATANPLASIVQGYFPRAVIVGGQRSVYIFDM